jgi:hypothetical protein
MASASRHLWPLKDPEPAAVLLTGATGFLGGAVLLELLLETRRNNTPLQVLTAVKKSRIVTIGISGERSLSQGR